MTTLWSATRGLVGSREKWTHFEEINAEESKCLICFNMGVVAWIVATGVPFVNTNPFELTRNFALRHDYTLCAVCAKLIEDGDVAELVTRRLAVDGDEHGFALSKTAEERRPLASSEIGLLVSTMDDRKPLLAGFTPDIRLHHRNGFAPGTLGDLKSPDDREPDCHRWISEHEPVDPFAFEDYKETFRHLYAYAIPNRGAIDAIARHSPNGVVDIGCGNGYWKFVLESNGIDVRGIDRYALGENPFWRQYPAHGRYWTTVGIHENAMQRLSKGNGARTLLLVWPPMDESMGRDALQAFAGDTLAYVGEWRGATGDNELHNALCLYWKLEETVQIPTLFGFFDAVRIFKRRSEDELREIARELSRRRGKVLKE